MDEQTKQAIGISVVIVVSVSIIGGYWYYKKVKKQRRIEELIKLTPKV